MLQDGAGRAQNPTPSTKKPQNTQHIVLLILLCLLVFPAVFASLSVQWKDWSDEKQRLENRSIAANAKSDALHAARALPATTPAIDLVKAYLPLKPLESQDALRFSTALCQVADEAADSAKALEAYEEAIPLGGCTPEQEKRSAEIKEQMRVATVEPLLASALAAIKKGSATKDPLQAYAIFEDAQASLEKAYAAGASDEDLGSARRSLAKARTRADCAVEKVSRESVVVDVLQPRFYKAGLDITASVSGKCGDTLTLEYVLWSGPTVYQFKETGIIDEMGQAGFKKVRLKGWDQIWSYDF